MILIPCGSGGLAYSVLPDDAFDRDTDTALAELAVVSDLRRDIAQALLVLGELRWLTKWDDETLCGELGCDPARWLEVGGSRAKDEKTRVEHSLNFLGLVLETTRLVDLTADRRAVLIAAVDLSAGAGGPIEARVERIRSALATQAEGGMKPSDLLGLGEIDRAWRSAALALGDGDAYDIAAAAAHLTSPVAAMTPHISPSRLAALAEWDASETLGGNVSARMEQHVTECTKCQRLAGQVAPGLLSGSRAGSVPARVVVGRPLRVASR